jgi:hypothetical protein
MNTRLENTKWLIRRYPRQGNQSRGLISFYYFWIERITLRGKFSFAGLFIFFLIEMAPGIQITAFWIMSIIILFILDVFWFREKLSLRQMTYSGSPLLFHGEPNNFDIQIESNSLIKSELTAALSRLPEPFLPQKYPAKANNVNQLLTFNFNLEPRYRRSGKLNHFPILIPGIFGLTNRTFVFKDQLEWFCFDKVKKGLELPYSYKETNFQQVNIDLNGMVSSTNNLELDHLREYQNGDPLRDIDHKAWARKGSPITKIFSDQNDTDQSKNEHLEFYFDPTLEHKNERFLFEMLVSTLAFNINQFLILKKEVTLYVLEDNQLDVSVNEEIFEKLCSIKPFKNNTNKNFKNISFINLSTFREALSE